VDKRAMIAFLVVPLAPAILFSVLTRIQGRLVNPKNAPLGVLLRYVCHFMYVDDWNKAIGL
jgi:hypothetical protein